MNAMKKIKSNIISTIIIVVIVLGVSLIIYRCYGYWGIKKLYPSDTVNIKFFLLKIYREIALWIFTILPITYLFHVVVGNYRKWQTYPILAMNVIIFVIGTYILYVLCESVKLKEFFITFVVYCVITVICSVVNIIYNKKNIKNCCFSRIIYRSNSFLLYTRSGAVFFLIINNNCNKINHRFGNQRNSGEYPEYSGRSKWSHKNYYSTDN